MMADIYFSKGHPKVCVTSHGHIVQMLKEDYDKISDEISRLRAALEFFADWHDSQCPEAGPCECFAIKKAKEALAEGTEGK